MQNKIVFGIVKSTNYVSKYDDDGIEYRLYTFTVDGIRYSAKTPNGTYIPESATIALEIEDGSSNQVLSGYCPNDGTKWGKNIGALKRSLPENAEFEYVKGFVIEKRKVTRSTYDNTRYTNLIALAIPWFWKIAISMCQSMSGKKSLQGWKSPQWSKVVAHCSLGFKALGKYWVLPIPITSPF